jgi:tetraacyldisaccharide 4'-kinase
MRRGLVSLGAVYGVAVAAKNLAYDRTWLAARRLRNPVIAIGNLSVGGSGKTPLTIRLAELLLREGITVDVLSRGYGRSSQLTERVDLEGSAARFGDEPLLIARRTGAPVFVGASRYEAGLLAEAAGGDSGHLPPIHLLDDGFQHRQLARDVDIVILHRSDFSERLLPAGRLREPLSALRRASIVVLREEDAVLEAKLRQLDIAAPVWWMQRSLAIPAMTKSGNLGRDGRIVAFCGIARPDEFFSALIARNVNVELAIPFADHHRYTREDIRRLATAATEARAAAFLTTEKDAVRLDSAMLQTLEAVAPVRVAKLEVVLRDEAAMIQQLLSILRLR